MPVYLYVCAAGHECPMILRMLEEHPDSIPCPECGCRAERDMAREQAQSVQQRPFKEFFLHAAGKKIESRDQVKKVEAALEKRGFVNVGTSDNED